MGTSEGVAMECRDGDDSALYDKGYNDGYRQAIIDAQASKKRLGKLRRETYQAPRKWWQIWRRKDA